MGGAGGLARRCSWNETPTKRGRGRPLPPGGWPRLRLSPVAASQLGGRGSRGCGGDPIDALSRPREPHRSASSCLGTAAAQRRGEAVDFSLTDEQRAIQETARAFARQEVDPIVDEIDESQRSPREAMLKAGELGFLGILFPEEYGGAGLGYVEYVLVVTELSRVDPSVGISVAAHNSLCSNHIYKFGNDEQRHRWLTPLASGRKIGAWRLTEPGAG